MDVGIVVDKVGDLVDELDDRLCHVVAGRRLCAEQERRGREVGDRAVLDAEVEVKHTQRVEHLALVLVQTLDLYIKDEVGGDLHALVRADIGGEFLLICVLDALEVGQNLGKVRRELFELGELGVPAGADLCVDDARKFGVIEKQPAAGRDAVGDVDKLFREALVPVFEGLRL